MNFKNNMAFIFLIAVFSILLSGCTKQTNEQSYTIDFKINPPHADSIKYRIYAKGNKWRLDNFLDNSDTLLTSDLYDGKDYFIIPNDNSGDYIAVKVKYKNKESIENNNKALPIFRWREKLTNQLSLFDGEPQKKETKRTKYGADCQLYEYAPYKNCNQKNNRCATVKRYVCVNDRDLAVNIISESTSADGKNFKVSLDVTNIDYSDIDNSIFKKPSVYKKITESELNNY